MEGATFEKDALFFSEHFNGRTDFLITKFCGYAHFSYSEFCYHQVMLEVVNAFSTIE
jgi:hypothetical protein